MATLLLIIIYVAFISLGIPDSLLGAAWPVMQTDFGAPLETAGLLFTVVSVGTITSSLLSGRLLNRFGTGKITFVSTLLTAVGLLGFWFAPSVMWLFLFVIPLGLGAGAIDTGLNDYVATHYKAHHMSWLHCFWGVGATTGPIIMAQFISEQGSWRNGYLTIACVQLLLVFILLLSLPLWKNGKPNRSSDQEKQNSSNDELQPLKIKGVKWSLTAFLFYAGVETTAGLWGSSYLVNIKDLSVVVAAKWVAFYFAGITIGRFITGFITFKMSNRSLIRTGQVIIFIGALLLFLPMPPYVSLAGFIFIGLGLAPIFPCMLHETPVRFGKQHSQTIMGYQMAVAYTGNMLIPPLLGVAASTFTIGLLPFCIVGSLVIVLISSERINQMIKLRRDESKVY